MRKAKILFIGSNPVDAPPFKLDEELRLITEKIHSSKYRDTLDLVSVQVARTDDILQALNQHKPVVVHFTGVGDDTGIFLMDNKKKAKHVNGAALKILFKTLQGNIRLVVLNCCRSKIQAQVISEVIDCVIGMNTYLVDDTAITFAASLYRALGFGCSIKNAFDQGVAALLLDGIIEGGDPELVVRKDVNPNSIVITDTDEKNYSHESINFRPVEIDQSKFYSELIENFTLDELRIICFTLGIDSPDLISGDSIQIFTMNMIIYFKNRGKINLLIAECKKQRPSIKF